MCRPSVDVDTVTNVVATDNAVVVESVICAYRNLGRQAAYRTGDRSHRYPRQMRAHQFAGQNQHRARLIELRNTDGSQIGMQCAFAFAYRSSDIPFGVGLPV